MEDTIRGIRKLFHATASLQTKLLSQVTINRFLNLLDNPNEKTFSDIAFEVVQKLWILFLVVVSNTLSQCENS
jgi:hypothetical protein